MPHAVHGVERSLLRPLFGKITFIFLIHFFLAYAATLHSFVTGEQQDKGTVSQEDKLI
jgi:hypothetical protein